MSRPNPARVCGNIEYEGRVYDSLSQPFGKSQRELINQYRKEHGCAIALDACRFQKFSWRVENDKLFLIDASFSFCKEVSKSPIEEIFGESVVFAQWCSQEVKVLLEIVGKKPLGEWEDEYTRSVMILKFENGVLLAAKEETETYTIRRLKNYTPE